MRRWRPPSPPPTRHPERHATGADPIEVEPQPFELRLEVFAGPLDLLLQLIESRQLDVLTVPLAAMADAYVEHLANHPVPADELADFVAIASQLILLKSRACCPATRCRPAW